MVTTRDWPQEGTWEKRGSAGLPPPTWGHGQRGWSPDGAGQGCSGAGRAGASGGAPRLCLTPPASPTALDAGPEPMADDVSH